MICLEKTDKMNFQISPVVKNLLVLNVFTFILSYLLDIKFGIISDKNPLIYFPIGTEEFKPWQIITHMFMHANLPHLLSNCLGLFFLGPIVEYSINSKRFILLYFVSGLVAMAAQIVFVNNTPLLGASGAIYGIFAALAVIHPNVELMLFLIPYPIKAKYLIPALIFLDLVLGVISLELDPVARFAHVGGAVAGAALSYYWIKKHKLGN